MKGHSYSVEFRINCKQIDPGLITNELGLKPVRLWEAGDPYLKEIRTTSLWGFNGEGEGDEREWETLEEGLNSILDALWPRRDIIDR
ncbi:MAG: hypothetical protein JWP91_3938 [Fibrobacteres bacterium]|nr:hypothetical protein [Fibrobacterota bacterium]